MSKLLKRGFDIYKIFLKNKLAMSIMMLFSGVMMFVSAINGRGNDTVMMPLGITTVGAALTFWGFYRIGYDKSRLDSAQLDDRKKVERAEMILQIFETLLYLVVASVGVFLLLNQGFTNMVLNVMAGFFTTLNGVIGVTQIIKKRDHRDFRFYFKILLTFIELFFGIYFIVKRDSIELGWFVAMGALTTIAGIIEVFSALTPEVLKGTMQDGKDIVRILRDNQN